MKEKRKKYKKEKRQNLVGYPHGRSGSSKGKLSLF